MTNCPMCGSTNLQKAGHTKIGTQRYMCKDCGRRSCGDRSLIKLRERQHEIHCKYCGSQWIRKKGLTKGGNPMYYCNKCGRKFVPASDQYRTTHISDLLNQAEMTFIIRYHVGLNVPLTEIAQHIHKDEQLVQTLIWRWTRKNGYKYSKRLKKWMKKEDRINGKSTNISSRCISDKGRCNCNK